jgi:hypothetical protein
VIVREAIVSLYGAWRLARLDTRGFELFDKTPAGAMRSFYAAVLVAPMYAAVALMLPAAHDGSGGLRWLLVETIAYVVSWLAYPVIAEQLTRTMECRERFEGYLSAYNWSMVLQNAVLLPLAGLTALDALPADLMQILWLVAIVAIMGYLWFIARTALEVGAFVAAGLVLLDELLSLLIDGIAKGLF